MSDEKPPLAVDLVWEEGQRFEATVGSNRIVIDGKREAGPSPVELTAAALAGCMAIDAVDILTKGRHPVTGLRVALTGERAPSPPKRITKVQVRFEVHGDVPPAAVERALALSHDKYCSVWHSLRQDIELTTAFDILA